MEVKPLSKVTELQKKDFSVSKLPGNVCMHVLGSALPDVRVMREAMTLRDAGYRVSIVDIESHGYQPVVEDFEGITLRHITMSKAFLTTRFARWTLFRALAILMRGTLCLIRTPADIYHAHDVSGLLPCFIAAGIRRKPLIFDSHEMPLTDMSIQSYWFITLLSFLLRQIIPHCAGVITVSSPIARAIHTLYRGPEVSLVRNIPLFKPVLKSDLLRKKLGLQQNTRIALFQGNLQDNRGLDLLIRAAKFLDPGIVFVLMGKDIAGNALYLEALAVQENVAERIRIIPPAPYAELLNWTASADLGLIIYRPNTSLNIRMCLPNKFFEYLMAGLPVVASQLDAIEDIVGAYNVGRIVTQLTPEMIAETINTVLADLPVYENMHLNALAASKKELCWENEKQSLIELYQRVSNVRRTQKIPA